MSWARNFRAINFWTWALISEAPATKSSSFRLLASRPTTNIGIKIGQMALWWFIAEAWMSFGWLRPLGRSQPKDILDEAINQHKVICPILMTIIARQNLLSLLIPFSNLWFDEVPARGLAAILFRRLLGVRGRASWELLLGIIFFSSSFFWVFYGFNVWSIYNKLYTRPHFRKYTFIYILLFDFSVRMFRYHSNRHCAESRP